MDLQVVAGNRDNASDVISGPGRRGIAIHDQVATIGNVISRQQLSGQDAVSWKNGRTHAAAWNPKRFVDETAHSGYQADCVN